MAVASVLEELLAVVGDDDEQRVVVAVEQLEQAQEARVDVADPLVVAGAHVVGIVPAGLDALGHAVRLVHVVQVHVGEAGLLGIALGLPAAQRAQELLARCARLAIEPVEAAREAHLRPDVDVGGDAEGLVAVRGEHLGQRGGLFGEPGELQRLDAVAVLGRRGDEPAHDAVARRVEAGQEGRRRRRRPARGRARLEEHGRLAREAREERRGLDLVAVGREVVGAQRVDDDQDDVRAAFGGRLGAPAGGERAEQQGQAQRADSGGASVHRLSRAARRSSGAPRCPRPGSPRAAAPRPSLPGRRRTRRPRGSRTLRRRASAPSGRHA